MQTQNRVGEQFGNYRLTQLIGSGGYAEVYLATHIHLSNRQYAIKILTGTNLQDEQRDSFLTEARTVSDLQHLSSHIVQIQDFGIQTSGNAAEDGIPYLVMEYAPEGTMRTLYPHNKRVPLDRIIFYINQVAEALQCAHNQIPPIVHRDIKPENMLLRTCDHLLLSDFGIAITGQATSRVISVKEKEIVGTVTYMAPERLSKHTRRASDQYSLGIVVYEWLSGSPPFDGTEKEIIYQQLVMPPRSLSSQYPHITKEIESVVFRALEKEPDDRYPNIKEFASALEQAVQNARQHKLSIKQPNIQPGFGAQQSGSGAQQGTVLPQQVQSLLNPSQAQTPSAVPTLPLSQVQPLASDLPTLPAQRPLTPAQLQPQAQSPLTPAPNPQQPQIQQVQSPTPIPLWVPKPQSVTIPDPQPPISLPPVVPQQQVQVPLPLILPNPLAQVSLPPIISNPQTPLSPLRPTPQNPLPPLNLPQSPQYKGAPFPRGGGALLKQRGGVGRIRHFFDFSSQFLWSPYNAFFIYGGLFLNMLSAILIGFLLHNPLALIASLIFSFLTFMLCICAVEASLAIFFGALVAIYWLSVGWIGGRFLASWLHLNPSLPPLFLGSIFFIVSLVAHARYAARKNI